MANSNNLEPEKKLTYFDHFKSLAWALAILMGMAVVMALVGAGLFLLAMYIICSR